MEDAVTAATPAMDRAMARVVRLKITPWRDRSCHRTVELPEGSTLQDVHQLIQREFDLDDDHLWAFFLSGEYFDRETEFGTGERARSPRVRLAELSLSPGMRIAYVFDFGDELRHDVRVESVGPAAGPAGPRVVERVGTPPPQYPDPEREREPVTPVPVPRGLEVLVDAAVELIEAGGPAARSPQGRAKALELAGRVLDACPTRAGLRACSGPLSCDLEGLLRDLMVVSRGPAPDPEHEALEWRFARHPRGPEEGDGFDPELIARVRWALLRYREFGDLEERLEQLPFPWLEETCDAILAACPDRASAAELMSEVGDRAVTCLLLDRLEVAAPAAEEAVLASLVERTARAVGMIDPYLAAARALSEVGQREGALAVLGWLERAAARLEPRDEILIAAELARAGDAARAEALYRRVLEYRWLSREARSETVVRLAKLLEATGRDVEARALMRREQGRLRELEAQRSGTVVREAPKVGRNDPCSCGSGKKAKRCCGAAD
jgi:pRiA4b ORF-3-like protein/SEC-C motif-containing protein